VTENRDQKLWVLVFMLLGVCFVLLLARTVCIRNTLSCVVLSVRFHMSFRNY